jgi:glutathione-regulated potassium-efflux system ancillary protein KefG
VDTAQLIDARVVAQLLGLSHPNSVSTYQHRYPDMPRPVVDLGEGRCKLWLHSDVVEWGRRTGRKVQTTSKHEGKKRD